MTIRKTVLFTFISIAVTASFAFAQGSASSKKTCPPYDDPKIKGDASPIVDAIDANKDGKMTKEEWLAAGAPIESFQSFMSKDKDKKGYVTRQEFIDETPPNGVDANCDGKFTIKEFHDFGLQGPPGGGSAPAGTVPAQK
jgi:hypothetical protein